MVLIFCSVLKFFWVNIPTIRLILASCCELCWFDLTVVFVVLFSCFGISLLPMAFCFKDIPCPFSVSLSFFLETEYVLATIGFVGKLLLAQRGSHQIREFRDNQGNFCSIKVNRGKKKGSKNQGKSRKFWVALFHVRATTISMLNHASSRVWQSLWNTVLCFMKSKIWMTKNKVRALPLKLWSPNKGLKEYQGKSVENE